MVVGTLLVGGRVYLDGRDLIGSMYEAIGQVENKIVRETVSAMIETLEECVKETEQK